MSCHACGGPEDDRRIREMMGCDGPPRRPHRINMGNEEEIIHTCPRKLMTDAVPYLKAHRWSAKGNLSHLYTPGQLPAIVAEAIDLLDVEQNRRLEYERSK